MEPFRVVAWVTKALDQLRRATWNKLRKQGRGDEAGALKGARWALQKNPVDLTKKQRSTLAELKQDNRDLFAGYLLKEQLRAVFQTKGWEGCWLPSSPAKTIEKHRDAIQAALLNGLSNARLEGVNTKLKLLTRLAYGFHSHKPLIALAMMKLGGSAHPSRG